MLRYYFVFIVSVGLLSSLLTTCGSRMAAGEAASGVERTISVQAADDPRGGKPDSIQQATGNSITLYREWDGHFYADTQINGTNIRMLVDTGASGIALSRDDARRAGIGISIGMPNVVAQGAGGDVKGELVTIDRIALGGKSAETVPAVVLDGGQKSLLGQSFLAKFDSVEIRGETMVLH